MLKLYLLSFILGFYIFNETLIVWMFSFGVVSPLTYITFIPAIMLFVIVPALLIYNFKYAAAVGIIGLIGILPFGIHWIWFLIYNEYWQITHGIIIGIAIIVYVVATFYSLKVITNNNKPIKAILLKRPMKLLMAYVPVVLLLLEIGLVVINP